MDREEQIKARILQVLALDPQKPVVSAITTTTLAREWAAHHALPDSDVGAERSGCAGVMRAAAERFAALLPADMLADPMIDLDAFQLELRRFDEAIRGIGLGLHRQEN